MSVARLALPVRLAIAAALTPVVDKYITKPLILKEVSTNSTTGTTSGSIDQPSAVAVSLTSKSAESSGVSTANTAVPVSVLTQMNKNDSWIRRKLKEIRNRVNPKGS